MKCDTLALFNINFRDFAINENRKTDIFLSVSKAKENLLLYFPPFDTIFRYQAVFYYQKGEFYHYDRYRKSALAGPAPIGGSSRRNRVKERKARTRRLIQTGAILEKVLPEVRTMGLQALEEYLLRRIPQKD